MSLGLNLQHICWAVIRPSFRLFSCLFVWLSLRQIRSIAIVATQEAKAETEIRIETDTLRHTETDRAAETEVVAAAAG
jgi:hypothetical protein